MRTSGRPPTVLFLVTEDWYFVSHRLDLARAAVQAGYRVVVATRVTEHGAVIQGAGLELRPLHWRRSGNTVISQIRALRELVRLYAVEQPDLVHHVALKPVIFGTYAARRARVPKIVNALAGLGFALASEKWRARAIRPLLMRLLARALGTGGSRTIVQNRADRDALLRLGLPTERIALIRGAGVDPDAYGPAPAPSSPPIVLFASRMLWEKGAGEFVGAARLLRAEGCPARFVLVGRPDLDNPNAIPTSRLEQWQQEGVIEWWGHRTDMAAVLRAASVFCLPTRYGEGVPRVLLEAAATGLPLVVSDHPGCREVVTDGTSGIIVPAGDERAVAAAIRTLIADPARGREMGLAARSVVEGEFSRERVNHATLQVYRELLAS